MITFKQFLHEEDETDKRHAQVSDAAEEFIKHCSEFPDINNPLYRLSGAAWSGDSRKHELKTRVPRTRRSASIAGTGREQEFLFSQPSWAGYPNRRQSIFCSTTQEFEVGEPDEGGGNLLMIYPFDGVKIAVLNDTDLNMMNIIQGTSIAGWATLDELFDLVESCFNKLRGTEWFEDHSNDSAPEKLAALKRLFLKNGKFNTEANGEDEVADAYAEMATDDEDDAERFRTIIMEIPEKLSPEALEVKLVTSSGLDLPGSTRECWFSGKYLSIPYRYHEEFIEAVKELR